jgi:hypothetical protein
VAATELRDLLIPGIALEGGFDDPSWRPRARSAPTVFIQAAEQPTQEITRQPAIAARRPIWRRATAIGSAAVLLLAVGVSAMIATRGGGATRDTTKAVPQVGAPLPQVPLPSVSVLPSGRIATPSASAAATVKDTSALVAREKPKAETVPEFLRRPIDSYASAIESGFVERMVRVYPAMDDKKDQLRFWNDFFNSKDRIKATVDYEGFDYQTPILARVNFRLNVTSRERESRLAATQLKPLYVAELVKYKGAWQISKLEERR